MPKSVADSSYALDLMGASYVVGGIFDTFWILAFLLIGWASLEYPRTSTPTNTKTSLGYDETQQHAEAFIPAVALSTIFAAVAWHGLETQGHIFLLFAPAAMTFAIFLGLRQDWSLKNERRLRTVADLSREELAQVLESTTDSV